MQTEPKLAEPKLAEPKQITPRGTLNAVVAVPGSKSITNRALLLAALAEGNTNLKTNLIGGLQSEDTQVMQDAIRQTDNFRNKNASGWTDIYVGNSGTTARFLTAVLAFTDGEYRIYGKPRMHERPIKDLVDALNSLGGNVTYEGKEGFPPVIISPPPFPIPHHHSVSIPGNISSQFLSALLMAAPLAATRNDIRLNVSGELVSKPYVEMTLRMMETFGVKVHESEVQSSGTSILFRIPRGARYRSPGTYEIEPDASAASYFFAAAAICGGDVAVEGLPETSLQGDVKFADCLARMGCNIRRVEPKSVVIVSRPSYRPLRGITVDMNSISDYAEYECFACRSPAAFASHSSCAKVRVIEYDFSFERICDC